MSETPRSEQPKDLERVAQETIDKWRQKLPEAIHDWWKKEGEDVPPEEIFEHYDSRRKEESDKNRNSWEARVKEGKTTNNFHILFSPDGTERLLGGEMSVYAIKPFYINARFNNAWSRMCEQFSDDVKRIIKYEIEKYPEVPLSDDDENSLRKMALYLGEEGVEMFFVCK